MNNSISFIDWKNSINELVRKEINLNIDDLPDQQYRFLYDSKLLSIKAISYIILGDFFKNTINDIEFILDN
jgi:hypothetical protein|tara:strand:- start:1095 stop:1307 length:213 start_codon:yes stop_codon:yes gene_type:complete